MVVERLYERAYTARIDSGLRIFAEEDPQSRSVSVGTWINVGSRDDPCSSPGLAHFIEHLAFKGTTSRDAAQISREIDSVGGNLNAATGRESTVFYADVPADGVSTALDLVVDLVRNPAFAPEKVDLERTVILDEIRGHEDDPEATAFDRFIATVWDDDHALSRSVLGTREAIEAASHDEVAAYHDRHYRPDGMVLAASGAIEVQSFIDDVTRRFGPSADPRETEVARVPPRFHDGRHENESATGQTHIYMALPGPPADDPDRYALELLNVVLGDGTSSRLFRAIREDRGLAYSVGSTFLRYTDAGLWMLYAGTAPNRAPEVQGLLEGELSRLRDEPPDGDEIALAKARLRGLFILGMEANANRTMRLGTAAVAGREILSPEDVLLKLDAVSAADIASVIERFLRPEKLHVTTVGPSA